MRRILFYIYLIFTLWCAPALAGHGVLVLYCVDDSEAQDEMFSGFQKVYKGDFSKLKSCDLTIAELKEKVKQRNPAVIYIMGSASLHMSKDFSNVPIVYSKVTRPGNILSGQGNITGISVLIPEEKVFEVMTRFVPGKKIRVGMLYSKRSVRTANRARDIARESDKIKFYARRVENENALQGLMDDMKGEVNYFWLLRDFKVCEDKMLKRIFRQCRKKKVAVLTFNERHHKRGAFVTIEDDIHHTGMQAAGMVLKILQGAPVSAVPPQHPEELRIMVHMNVANMLGIEITEEMLETVEPYYDEIR